jgi:hypothetical protein
MIGCSRTSTNISGDGAVVSDSDTVRLLAFVAIVLAVVAWVFLAWVVYAIGVLSARVG